MEPRKPYPTDLNDHEWALIKHLVPEAKPGGRPEKYPTREILNGIFYRPHTNMGLQALSPEILLSATTVSFVTTG